MLSYLNTQIVAEDFNEELVDLNDSVIFVTSVDIVTSSEVIFQLLYKRDMFSQSHSIPKIRLCSVRAAITVMYVRKFYEICKDILCIHTVL